MRILKFKVSKQVLESDGDFNDLVSGTKGYLSAQFTFSEEWDDCTKVASFFDRKGVEHARYVKECMCEIPPEALTDRYFRLKVVGAKKDYRITTNKLKITQKE